MGNAGDCFLGFFLKVKYSIYIIFTFFWQLFDVICQGVSKWQPCSQALQENIKKQYFRILCIPTVWLLYVYLCKRMQLYMYVQALEPGGRGLAPPPFTLFVYIYIPYM